MDGAEASIEARFERVEFSAGAREVGVGSDAGAVTEKDVSGVGEDDEADGASAGVVEAVAAD